MNLPPLTRRQFLENSMLAAAAAAMAPLPLRAAEETSVSANDKITVAIIGCGIRGKQHAKELAKLQGCEIAYVCDPDRARADEVAALVVESKRPAPKAVPDLRTILDDKSVDAVFIASCNHWHALSAIWSMQAGKDVYVEKPVSHNVTEGRRMVQAARKLGRICQGGTQNRSNSALAAAVDYIGQGKLGTVKLARSIIYGGRGSIGGPGAFEIPAGVDYNLWAGPAPMKSLDRPKLQYDWHWVWDTGNGELGNNNVHSLDICRWALGVRGLGNSAVSYGGRFGYTDAGETPNTQVCVFDYGDKAIISETRGLKSAPYRPEFKGGWIIEGTEGFIAGTSLFDPEGKLIRTFEGKTSSHFANFLQAVRSRKRGDLTAEIEEGHLSSALCHIGNISWRLGKATSPADLRKEISKAALPAALETFDRTMQHLQDNQVDMEKTPLNLGPRLLLDPAREAFRNAPEADTLLSREYRSPFNLPAESAI